MKARSTLSLLKCNNCIRLIICYVGEAARATEFDECVLFVAGESHARSLTTVRK